MNKSTYALIGGVIGAAIGAVGTYFYMRTKMADTITTVVSEMRDYYQNDSAPSKEKTPKVEESEVVRERSFEGNPNKTLKDYKDYTKCRPVPFRVDTEMTENEDGELEAQTLVKMGEEENLEPYSIPPEEFDSDNGYKKIMLVWYEKNKVLAYDNNPRITMDPEYYSTTVGDFENHFNDWEKDTVYMRNDVEEIDYEIDACLTNYDEMIKVLPWDEPDEEEDGPIDG